MIDFFLLIVSDCGPLVAPDNGLVAALSTLQDSTAVYSCIQGYDLEGDRERVCQASNGHWSRSQPQCTRK